MLIRRDTLDRIGGVDSIRHEIIDDCALARRVKAVGKVWLGAADDTVSIREYGSWRPIWDMIARCAFAQLGYSAPALLGTVAGMALVYFAPPVLLLAGPAPAGFSARFLGRHERGIRAGAAALPRSGRARAAAAGGGAVLYGGDDMVGYPVLARPRRALEGPLPGVSGTLRRAGSGRHQLRFEDDLAGVAARQQRLHRRAGLGQREGPRDDRLASARLPTSAAIRRGCG